MIPSPERYAGTPVYDLIEAASKGHVGFDQRLIRTITDRREESIAALVRWTGEEHADAPVDLDPDLVDLFRHLRAPEAIPFLIDVMSAEPEDMPESLFEALYAIRTEALEPLLELYAALEEEQSGEVAFLLASFRIRDPRVLKLLLERVEYDLGDGVMLLGLYGDPEARSALEALKSGLTPDDEKLKVDIGMAIDDLDRVLEDTAVEYNIWEDFPDEVGPRFDLMDASTHLDLLSHESPDLRRQAAAAFGAIEYEPAVCERLLSVATSDADPSVRGACWDALGSEKEDPKIRAALLQRLQDRACPHEERAGALLGLATESAGKDVRPFAEELYADPATRAQAMKAMWASMDRSFSEFFPRHLDDPDAEVRRQAIWGIGYLAIYNSAEKLVAFFDQDEFRPDALFAYAMGVRYEISRGRIRGLFRRIHELAGGLSEEEVPLVQAALDERLMMHGQPPVFGPVPPDDGDEPPPVPQPVKAGRNDPCPCGSGKKYKKCCGA